MPGASQRAYQREDLTLRMRRPPEEYVSLLSQNEQEFRTYVTSFEDSPLFSKLLSDGTISKVRLRGKIPRQKYEEFMDYELFEFLRRYNITAHDNWEADFLSPHALDRVPELAKKYDVPLGALLRQLRYLRASGRDAFPTQQPAQMRGDVADDSARDPIEAASGDARVDLSEIIEITRQFVERYDVSEQEFLDVILSGEATPEELAEQFECSLREAEEVLEAADRVYLAQSYEETHAPEPRKKSAGSPATVSEESLAYIQVLDGQLALQFDNESVYTQRYRINTGAIKGIKNDASLPTEARDLLMRARFINQRLSALSRLITTLCNQQLDYLGSGDVRKLKPLAQAELARQLGEHPSTVSRLIRGKHVETPYGKIPLLFLCQSKTDVVARLIAEFPHLTDQEVVSHLRENYDCFIARRTVAYHRGKRLRRNKRRRTKADETVDASANGTATETDVEETDAEDADEQDE